MKRDRTSEILRLHEQVHALGRKTLKAAIQIGKLLSEQKKSWPHGEWLPWIEATLPFTRITTTYAWFLARWVKRLSWAQVAEAFHTSWYTVYRAVEIAVTWGRSHLNKAIDQVRAAEAKELVRQGYEPVLKKTRWLVLKRPQNLTAAQDLSLRQLLCYNLRTVRSYLLKEQFQLFWS